MIISHKYKFIFIKTTKTAGTSIEVDLNKILGKDDIATPIFPPVDGHTAKNFRYGPGRNDFFYNHIPASKIRSVIGEKLFHDYFSFCVERDPIDKCISHYSMAKNSNLFNKNQRNKNLNFEKYIKNNHFPIDFDKYTDHNGNVIVDKIIKYESLESGLFEISNKLGFEFCLKSKAKSGWKETVEPNEEQKHIIINAFQKSNIITGYY